VLAYARLANVEMNEIVDDDLELTLPKEKLSELGVKL
jgi:hypothetical protein